MNNLIACGWGILWGFLLHDPVCNFADKIHDCIWKPEMKSCENCKWFNKILYWGFCRKLKNELCNWIVSEDDFCDEWEEMQKYD